jgi:tetratricopeptide (TPR) repeat protein
VLSGTAGNAVVAGAVAGGIHFHDSAQRHRLPQQVPRSIGNFVNRIAEVDALGQAAALTEDGQFENPIILITGTAGVGKTSLAVRWARQNAHLFPDGQLYLNLRGFDSVEPVAPLDALVRLLVAMGMPENGIPIDIESAAAEFRTRLDGRRLLLLLDNAATIDQVRPLLPGHDGCLVLTTSRNSLSGLMSQDGAKRIDLRLFTPADSVLLLKKILSRADSPAEDDDDNLAELAQLCARLPLALRVAAELAIDRPRDSRLIDLINDLRGKSQWDSLSTDDGHHADAIRSVFSWSYRALAQSAARMFRLLGLHPGQEFSAGAAAALAGIPLDRAETELRRLVSAHMIETAGPGRYQFHDLLRAYAAAQANDDPEEERTAAVNREVAWYTHSAAAAVEKLQKLHPATELDQVPAGCEPVTFADDKAAIEWYEAERTNLRSISGVALQYHLRRWTWQLAIALYPIHHATRSSFRDWLFMADDGLEAAEDDNLRLPQAEILTSRGVALERPPRQLDNAGSDLAKAREIWQELLDEGGNEVRLNSLRGGKIRCLNATGWVRLRQRRLVDAAEYFDQIHEPAHEIPPSPWRVVSPENSCVAHYELGDLDRAADLGTRALAALASLATVDKITVDPRIEFDILMWLVRVQRERGLLTEATAIVGRMLEITEAQRGFPGYLMVTRLEQGRLDLALGNAADALLWLNDAQREYGSQGDQTGEAAALDGIGDAYLALSRADTAQEFFQAAADGFTRSGEPWNAASALAKLSEALAADGDADRAQGARDAALSLIASYQDPRCTALRRRLDAQTGA